MILLTSAVYLFTLVRSLGVRSRVRDCQKASGVRPVRDIEWELKPMRSQSDSHNLLYKHLEALRAARTPYVVAPTIGYLMRQKKSAG